MKKLLLTLLMLFGTLMQVSAQEPGGVKQESEGNIISLELRTGIVLIELFPDKAPKHVKQLKELVAEKFYDGLAFHRVIDGFMAQTGDPKGDGTGRSKKPNIPFEYNDLKHTRGAVSMARAADLDSANSQFFIMLDDAPHLDGKYTVFGRVISGMEHVDEIKKGDPNKNGFVKFPDRIKTMRFWRSEK